MPYFSIKSVLMSGVSILAATSALAQDSSSGDVLELEAIEIYGDRGSSTLAESTSSIAVIPEERVNTAITQSVTDTFKQTVNVQDGDFVESGFVIRGINSEGMTPGGAGAPLASIYVDGVQQTAEAARRGVRSTFDTEQIEIYRGPQSTLSGRNALAGAIYVRTKDPEFFASGRVQLTYGENNKRELAVAYGDALSENLAYRLSGVWSKKDSDLNYPSYADYPQFDELTTDEYYTLRGKLLWLPTHSEDTKVLLSYARSYDSPESNTIAGAAWNPASGVDFSDRRGDIYGSLTPPSWGVTPLPIFQDVRNTTTDNIGLEISHEFNSNLTLTALTSYSGSITDRRSVNYGYEVGSPFDPEAWNVLGDFDQRTLSQEIRLNYDSDELRWVGGLYIADENNKYSRDQFAVNGSFTSVETTKSRTKNNIANYALFGEATYEFAPNWNVVAGGRLDYYKQDQSTTIAVEDYFAGPLGETTTSSSHSESEFIPKIGVTYDIDASNKLALTYQEGYRPGGAGVRFDNGTPFTYKAEQAKNIELTWRGSPDDGRTNFGASIFYQDWKNQQVEIWQIPNSPDSSVIVNAGNSVSYGGELDVTYQANDTLDVYAGVGLLKTEFKDFSIGSQNLAGQAFSNAPEQSIVLGFLWGEDIGWFANGNVKYVSSSLSRVEAYSDRAVLDSYTTVDAQVGYTWDQGPTLIAYANNLFNEEFFTYMSASGSQASLGARREVGLQLRQDF